MSAPAIRTRWTAKARRLEVHHRISNHLQILASLIGLQAQAHESPVAAEALMGVRRRILAVARLHAALQRAETEESIEIAEFLQRLGEDLKLIIVPPGQRRTSLIFHIESAKTPAETALTVALIVNELVTNAAKYAAGSDIEVSLGRCAKRWRLTVADEGGGLPLDALTQTQGEGLGLVRLLAKRLKGSVRLDKPRRGASISVYFP